MRPAPGQSLPLAAAPSPRRRGLTLVETMLAMVLLSVAVFGVLSTLVAGEQQLQEADHALAASRLARDLLEEIVGKAYQDPQEVGRKFGPENGESDRTKYDDCDDYDDYRENPGQARNAAGTLYAANQQVFERRVKVSKSTATVPALGATVPGLVVEVTVQDRIGRKWIHTRFIQEPL